MGNARGVSPAEINKRRSRSVFLRAVLTLPGLVDESISRARAGETLQYPLEKERALPRFNPRRPLRRSPAVPLSLLRYASCFLAKATRGY